MTFYQKSHYDTASFAGMTALGYLVTGTIDIVPDTIHLKP
jgi:hypothetical protein